MISSRRKAHRSLVFVLAPIASVVFVTALMQPAPNPVVDRLPTFLEGPQAHLDGQKARNGAQQAQKDVEPGAPLWVKEDLFSDWPARVSAYRRRVLELKPLRPLIKPDVLVYWTPERFSGATLPQDAHLLGRIGGTSVRRFVLPDHGPLQGAAAPNHAGSLVLYSLGHQEVVTVAVLPALRAEAGASR